MPDLSPDQVAAIARAAQLPMTADDLAEVTHRLNAFLEALTSLVELPLDAVEPTPFSVAPIAFGGETHPLGPGPSAPSSRAPSRLPGPNDLAFAGAVHQASLVRDRQVSPVELVQLYVDRIERLDGRLHGFITVCAEHALEGARQAEAAVMRGEALGPLHGVPIGVKDQFDTAGIRTTVGSRIFADRVPSEDATLIVRLRSAGAVLIGKQNLTEFAFGGTIAPPFGQPHNPWNVDHDPGASSSGSGVATAAALCAASIGEDTGGSVRGPAAWCGVAGLRPTWGLVSRRGSFPLCWSMDTAGPLARTVEDVAVLLGAIAGHDPGDPLTSRRPVPDYRAALAGSVRGLRLGLIRELTDGQDTAPDVRSAVREAARVLEGLGATVEEISIPILPRAGSIFMAVADADGAGLHHARLRTRSQDYDQATRRRLLTASVLPSALHHVAARGRALVRRDVLGALARHDLLLAPSAHRAAPTIADSTAPIRSRQEAAGRFFTRRSYSSPASLAGVPAMAVPCGFTASGLPLSLQIIGRPFEDAMVLRAAHAYEQATEWHRRRPAV